MIVMRIHGGLGNQMFQYALGVALAREHGCKLKLDIGSFDVDPVRRFALGAFSISADVATADDMLVFGGGLNLHPRLRRLLNVVGLRHRHVVRERQVAFDSRVLSAAPPLYLDGYWQTARYFERHAEEVRREFQPRSALSSRALDLVSRMECPGTVSIHVRRGDYVASPKTLAYHGICEVAWYKRALDMLRSRVALQHAFVFSDDLAWCRDALALGLPCTFVDAADRGADHEDLLLMTRCRHHIIANSSFSWWAAWLGTHPETTTIAPLHWFGEAGPKDTQDLCPPSWIRLP